MIFSQYYNNIKYYYLNYSCFKYLHNKFIGISLHLLQCEFKDNFVCRFNYSSFIWHHYMWYKCKDILTIYIMWLQFALLYCIYFITLRLLFISYSIQIICCVSKSNTILLYSFPHMTITSFDIAFKQYS